MHQLHVALGLLNKPSSITYASSVYYALPWVKHTDSVWWLYELMMTEKLQKKKCPNSQVHGNMKWTRKFHFSLFDPRFHGFQWCDAGWLVGMVCLVFCFTFKKTVRVFKNQQQQQPLLHLKIWSAGWRSGLSRWSIFPGTATETRDTTRWDRHWFNININTTRFVKRRRTTSDIADEDWRWVALANKTTVQ